MKITTVTVTLSRTVRPRPYESVSATFSQTAEVEEGDKVTEVRKILYQKTSDALDVMLNLELDRHNEGAPQDA